MSEIGAAQTSWETEVVFDRGAHARLTTRRLPLDNYGAQSLGGSVDSRGQASRTAADNA
jgi:hypothetical protein